MRTWLYQTLIGSDALKTWAGVDSLTGQVVPRFSQTTINLPKPFLVYGLGNDTNESLSEDADHLAHRQFFQIWVHDEGGDYDRIDRGLGIVKTLLVNQSDRASNLTTINWLETSQEFNSEQYNTIFRYLRFQAIISKGVTIS